ncbi:MAG: flagellin, partial [Hoeflea sp.]|nr:flagellin [Hoeflea sp.]
YGAVKGRIDMQSDFAKSLSQSIDMGVGRLVDANMNEESSRLKALQTQQQLGLQSLSIANSNAQTLLTLFS